MTIRSNNLNKELDFMSGNFIVEADYPGGNMILDKIDGNEVFLHQDMRDSD